MQQENPAVARKPHGATYYLFMPLKIYIVVSKWS